MKFHRDRRAFQEREQLEQRMKVGKHLTVLESLVQHDWSIVYMTGSSWRGDEDLFEMSLIYVVKQFRLDS